LTPPFRKALDGLFLLLHHPFVLPISHVDLLKEQNNVVMMQQLSAKGSLKDKIYKANPIMPWRKKYMTTGRPLPMDKIVLYGRQILEGMLFLKKKQIPYRNLHSGNVILDGDRCRITGFENPLLGYTPKLIHRAGKALGPKDKDPLGNSFDIVCFGHLLFEMALGYELTKTRPDVEQLVGKCAYELVELFVFIFFHPDDRIPTLEEVMNNDHVAFKSIRVPELEGFKAAPSVYTKEIKQVLRAVQKNVAIKVKSRRSAETPKRRSSSSLTAAAPEAPAAHQAAAVPPPPPPAAAAAAPPPPPHQAAPVAPPPPAAAAAPPAPAPAAAAAASPAPANNTPRGGLLAALQKNNKAGLKKAGTGVGKDANGQFL